MRLLKKKSQQKESQNITNIKVNKVKSLLEPEMRKRKITVFFDYSRFKTESNVILKEELPIKYSMYKGNDKISYIRTSQNGRNFTYHIQYGNNSNLIRRLMLARNNWVENNQNPNFIWKPTSQGIRFSHTSPELKKKVFNHIENHQELTDKAKLFLNVSQYCNKHETLSSESIFPSTYVFEYNKSKSIETLHQFIELFQLIKNNTNLKNIWIYKPSDLNRGRGIALLDSLQQLKKILLEETSNYPNRRKWFNSDSDSVNNNDIYSDLEKILLNSKSSENRTFVLQKYIQNPLLFQDRKFDIRMWVLVDHEKNYYLFKEGYIRMSSQLYQLNSKSLNNKFIHLTNNAIQKFSENYGKQEDGNQLSFDVLKKFLELKHKVDFNSCILKQIKQIITLTMKSVKKKLSSGSINLKNSINKYTYSSSSQQPAYFEIFGYDFLLDRSLNVYLLEVNTNPCLEQSSKLLETLVPRMVNDAFKLTIDKLFSTTNNLIQLEVQNYSQIFNMWEHLGNLNSQTNNKLIDS